MKWKEHRKREQKMPQVAEVPLPQIRHGDGFIGLEWTAMGGAAEYRLYDSLREAVPIIDAALNKIVALIGGFSAKCPDRRAEALLGEFLRKAPVDGLQHGISAFLEGYADRLLTYGTAVGEIVLDAEGYPAGLHLPDLRDVELLRGENPMSVKICRREGGSVQPVPFPQLICTTALRPEAGELMGRSLLKGLPFVSNILLRIYHTVGQNWERAGNLRYAVTYRPSSENGDAAFAKERAMQIAREWSRTMREQRDGKVSDFVAVGDVSIKVIGAEGEIPDSQVPVREMLEQIVAKLGIPPFLLGLSWSSTERMSAQQADILTSELEAYRRILEPALEKICKVWLRCNGFREDVEICWEPINLQDEVELANADYLRTRAESLRREMKKEKA